MIREFWRARMSSSPVVVRVRPDSRVPGQEHAQEPQPRLPVVGVDGPVVKRRRFYYVHVPVDEETVGAQHSRQGPHHRVEAAVSTAVGIHLVPQGGGADDVGRLGEQRADVLDETVREMTGAHLERPCLCCRHPCSISLPPSP
jgi:hypothetical protein